MVARKLPGVDTLADWADEWAITLHDQSEGTRVVYCRSVRQFREWLAEAHPGVVHPGDVTRQHVHGWLQHLADQGRNEATRRVRLLAVRLFFGYVVGEPDSGLTVNPAEGIKLPIPIVQPVPVIHDADLTALLRCTEGATFVDRRDHAALRLLLDTGCRRGELVGVDVDDVDLRTQEIMLRRTKGSRARVVPISNKTALAIRRYLRARARHVQAEQPPLFLSVRPTGGDHSRMTGNALGEMLIRRCAEAGIPPINPHRFRHSWASDMLSHGAAEGDVEKLAGWRSPLMIRRYSASTAEQRARDAARRLARGDRV